VALWLGVVFAAGCSAAAALPPDAATSVWVRVGCSAAGVGSALAAWLICRDRVLRGRFGVALLLATALLAGAAWSGRAAAEWRSTVGRIRRAGVLTHVSGTLAQDPLPTITGTLLTIEPSVGEARSGLVAVTVPSGDVTLRAGARVSAEGRFKAPVTGTPAGVRAMTDGVVLVGSASSSISVEPAQGLGASLWSLRARVLDLVTGSKDPGATLMARTVLGAKAPGSADPVVEAFRSAGLAHLPGPGALHVAILAFAAGLAVRVLARRPVPVLAGAASVVAASAYCVLTGAAAGPTRGVIAVVVFCGVRLIGRRTGTLAALGCAVAALALLHPLDVAGTDVWLGVAAVTAIATVGPLLRTWLQDALPRRLRGTAAIVAVGATAQLGSLPIAAAAFGTWSPMGPILSTVCAPFVVLGLLLGVALAPVMALAPFGVARAATAFAAQPFSWAAQVAAWGATTPWAGLTADASLCVTVLPVGVLAAWSWWRAPRSRGVSRLVLGFTCAAAFLPAVFPAAQGPRLAVVVMDVGQGDAILVRDGASTLLVDTGPAPAVLGRALRRNGASTPGAVVITHEHADHDGGLSLVTAATPAPAVYHSGAAAVRRSRDVPAPATLAQGDVLRVGRVVATVLWPPREGLPADTPPNDTSVVLDVRAGAHSALLLGDAETGVQELVAQEPGLRPVELLKAAHHGSTNGLCLPLLDRVLPSGAAVSVGVGNRYGHPAPSVMTALAGRGMYVLRTDQVGDITFDLATGRLGSQRTPPGALPGAFSALRDPAAPCATMTRRIRLDHETTADGDGNRRPLGTQAGLHHLRVARHPARPGRGPPQAARGGGRGPRLQLRDLPGAGRVS
jgi:competence protein ComEC